MTKISADDPEIMNNISSVAHGTRKVLSEGLYLYTGTSPTPNSSLYAGGKKEEKSKDDEILFALEKFTLDKHYAKSNFGKNGEVPPDLIYPKAIPESVAFRLILRHAREYNLHITINSNSTEFRFTALTEEQKRLRAC